MVDGGSCVDCKSIYICRTPNISHIRMACNFQFCYILLLSFFILGVRKNCNTEMMQSAATLNAMLVKN